MHILLEVLKVVKNKSVMKKCPTAAKNFPHLKESPLPSIFKPVGCHREALWM
jgi:hypothetical protein